MREGEVYQLNIRTDDQGPFTYTGELSVLGKQALETADEISQERGATWNIILPRVDFELMKVIEEGKLIPVPALDGAELHELQQLVPTGSALPWLMTVAKLATRKQVGLSN